MFANLMNAIVIIFAATGAVLLLMIFLQRLIRPDKGSYSLYVHLKEDDIQNEAAIGYAVQRIRFFGEENCTKVFVCCDGVNVQTVDRLKNAFSMYDFVRFIGLEGEKEQENSISCK
ncbi:MAG: hypothetical protein IKJ63_06015 [Clostridia bacterium]|nr:hypothetical protein [Clostridia bacterium]